MPTKTKQFWRAGAGLAPLLLTLVATPAFSLPVPRLGWPVPAWPAPIRLVPVQPVQPYRYWPNPNWSGRDWSNQNQLVADRRAEDVCINAAEDEGWRVTDVLERNSYEGGSEVIMRAQQRRGSITLGCDYADNTGRVQLYRLEGRDDQNYDDDSYGYDDRNNDYNDRYGSGRVNNRDEAEYIARQTIEEQLGVDANSDVIRISETRRNDSQWYVQGDVNGAPFAVRIDRNGSVEDFQLR